MHPQFATFRIKTEILAIHLALQYRNELSGLSMYPKWLKIHSMGNNKLKTKLKFFTNVSY